MIQEYSKPIHQNAAYRNKLEDEITLLKATIVELEQKVGVGSLAKGFATSTTSRSRVSTAADATAQQQLKKELATNTALLTTKQATLTKAKTYVNGCCTAAPTSGSTLQTEATRAAAAITKFIQTIDDMLSEHPEPEYSGAVLSLMLQECSNSFAHMKQLLSEE